MGNSKEEEEAQNKQTKKVRGNLITTCHSQLCRSTYLNSQMESIKSSVLW